MNGPTIAYHKNETINENHMRRNITVEIKGE